jgi:multisubunit Na+/H+ antiporter MnhE subunit
MDTISTIFSTLFDLLSHPTLLMLVIALIIGALIGWATPQPAWAKALWAKITNKAPVVATVATDAVDASTTVAADVTAAVTTVEATVTPAAPVAPATTTPAAQ